MLSARRPSGAALANRNAGFTVIELIMVIMITATLAVFVMPKIVDVTMWRLRSFGDDMQAQMQANLRMALVQRRPIVATITGTGVSFAYATGAAIGSLSCPASATPCISEGGSRTATFNNNNDGNTANSGGTALVITVASGTYSQQYQLENETGLIYALP